MRLGAYPAVLKEGTLVKKLYNSEKIFERHRHRYEVNPEYVEVLEKNGMIFSGKSPNGMLMEFIELRDHPFFVATQAHPEFKSRPLNPSPLFIGLIKASLEN
jgi:CTP synthase